MAISSTTCHALDPISATLKGIKPGKRLVEDEAHVFISFDEDEQNLADHIKRELEKLGFKCLSNNDIMVRFSIVFVYDKNVLSLLLEFPLEIC